MIDVEGVFIFDVRMIGLKRHLKAPIFKLVRNAGGGLEWQFTLKLIQREVWNYHYGTDNFACNEIETIKKLVAQEGYRIIRKIVLRDETKSNPLPLKEGDL